MTRGKAEFSFYILRVYSNIMIDRVVNYPIV